MSMMDFTGVDFGFGLEGLNFGDLRDEQGRLPVDPGFGTGAVTGGTGGVSAGANTKTITNTSSFTMGGREITRTTYSDGTYSDDDNGPTETLQDIYNANNAIETAQSNESMSSILAKSFSRVPPFLPMLRMIYQGVQFSRFLLCQIDANGSIHERERHKNQLLFENKGCKQLLKLAIHFHSKSHREISW